MIQNFIAKKIQSGLWSLVFSLIVFTAKASDLIGVSPITNKILMVYIKDGHIDSYGVGEVPANNVTYSNPTNINSALTKTNYIITSSDDGNYSSGKNPINMGRKSKAVDYNDEWQAVPYVWGHWIYIELPAGLIQGKTYTIQLNNIVENKNSLSFIYDVNTLRSETIHVNMIGFPQNAPKFAYLSSWMGDFSTSIHANGGLNLDDKTSALFRLINKATGATVFTGTISLRMKKSIKESGSGDYGPEGNYTLADVWECDFSSFAVPGEYVVAVDGIGCSYPFEINNEVTREPFYYAMKGLFWQRQGIAKEIEPGKIMPRDHHPDDILWKWDKNWAGHENNTGFNAGSPRVYGIWGYYHDAGDWDGYERHYSVPALLLLLYDLAPGKFKDGEVGNRYKLKESDAAWIDEGSNGLPDLLDEAAWLINYYKRARTVLKKNYGGTGGVPGYVGRDAVPSNNITAWQDNGREWYLSAENVQTTYDYAALAAWYAVCLNKFWQLSNTGNHPDYTSWVTEATEAYTWADAKNSGNSGDRGLAAACLYRVTGNTVYQTDFQNYYTWETKKDDGEWLQPTNFDLSISVFSLIPSATTGLNTTLQNTCKSYVQTKATNFKVGNTNANGFRCAIEYAQFFQLGPFNTPRQTLVPVAYYLTGDKKYLNAMYNGANYVLGGNQQNMVYISGLGERSDVWVFLPNGWLVNDYNSKVYSSEPLIGYTTYFGAQTYWFTSSVYSEMFSRTAAYPQAKDWPNTWPESESKFFNRYSIQGAEFTVNQNNNYMIYTMGFVKAMSDSSTTAYVPNTRPTLTLNLNEGQNFPKAGCYLTATTSPDTRSVSYYYEWHYIGESTERANDFSFFWIPPQASGTSVLITAVGFDDRGKMTVPSNSGDKTILLSSSATCTTTTNNRSENTLSHSVTIYPNPANQQSILDYSLFAESEVRIYLLDLLGKEIIKLKDEKQPAGIHRENLNLSDMQSGAYLIRMEINGEQFVKKVIVNKSFNH